MRKIHQNIPLRFAPHDWTVEETTFCEIDNKFQETIFCLGNGYLGVRGVFEEGYYGFVGNTIPATVINGIYEYHDLHHIWARPGFPTRQHAIINQPEAFQAHLYVNGERILMHPEKVSGYKRVLDMQHGLLRDVPQGDFVGYDRAYQTERDSKIAILPIGYGDGFPRNLSCGKASVKIGTYIVPIIGRICMDQLAIDITDTEGVAVGDTATLIDNQENSLLSTPCVAERSDSISNEILSRMGARLPIVIKE